MKYTSNISPVCFSSLQPLVSQEMSMVVSVQLVTLHGILYIYMYKIKKNMYLCSVPDHVGGSPACQCLSSGRDPDPKYNIIDVV